MTRTRFRATVALYFVLGTLALATGCVGESGLPAPLAQYLDQRRSAEPSMLEWVLLAASFPFLVATLVSFVGLLLFKRWSRSLSVATSLVGLLLLPLFGPTVEPGVTTAFNYAAGMLYGALLAWAYSPPAAAWFEAQSPKTQATR